jgi:hypothetical protein
LARYARLNPPAAGGSANIFTLVTEISGAIRAVSPVKHFRIDFS